MIAPAIPRTCIYVSWTYELRDTATFVLSCTCKIKESSLFPHIWSRDWIDDGGTLSRSSYKFKTLKMATYMHYIVSIKKIDIWKEIFFKYKKRDTRNKNNEHIKILINTYFTLSRIISASKLYRIISLSAFGEHYLCHSRLILRLINNEDRMIEIANSISPNAPYMTYIFSLYRYNMSYYRRKNWLSKGQKLRITHVLSRYPIPPAYQR